MMFSRGNVTCWRGVRIAVAAIIAFLGLDVHAQDATPEKPREIRLSVAVGPAFALGKAGERWAKLVGEKSAGRIATTLHPGATLAQRDPAREFLALRDGAADLAVGSSLFWAAQVKELGVVGLPWLASEARQLDALAQGDVAAALAAAVERAGAVPLAFAPLGYRELATWTRLVRTPADAHDLKVRSVAVPMLTDLYAGLSATTTAVAFAAAQSAFASGALDAQDGEIAVFASARIYALGAKHVTLWNAVGELAVFAANRAVWDGWSEDQRTAVRDAARAAAAELTDLARQESSAALTELRRRGMSVVSLTAAERAAFAVAVRPVYDKWAAAAGDDVARLAEAAVKAAAP
jgi:TRAP-type C4-dicarboxylate transport system substrate-binding protein